MAIINNNKSCYLSAPSCLFLAVLCVVLLPSHTDCKPLAAAHKTTTGIHVVAEIGKLDPGTQSSTPGGHTGTQPTQPEFDSHLTVTLQRRVVRLLLQIALFEVGANRDSFEGENTAASDELSRDLDIGNFKNCRLHRMTDEELEQLCNELCSQGVCPPDCPESVQPPWGRR